VHKSRCTVHPSSIFVTAQYLSALPIELEHILVLLVESLLPDPWFASTCKTGCTTFVRREYHLDYKARSQMANIGHSRSRHLNYIFIRLVDPLPDCVDHKLFLNDTRHRYSLMPSVSNNVCLYFLLFSSVLAMLTASNHFALHTCILIASINALSRN
jgi:hypothetical protein